MKRILFLLSILSLVAVGCNREEQIPVDTGTRMQEEQQIPSDTEAMPDTNVEEVEPTMQEMEDTEVMESEPALEQEPVIEQDPNLQEEEIRPEGEMDSTEEFDTMDSDTEVQQ